MLWILKLLANRTSLRSLKSLRCFSAIPNYYYLFFFKYFLVFFSAYTLAEEDKKIELQHWNEKLKYLWISGVAKIFKEEGRGGFLIEISKPVESIQNFEKIYTKVTRGKKMCPLIPSPGYASALNNIHWREFLSLSV